MSGQISKYTSLEKSSLAMPIPYNLMPFNKAYLDLVPKSAGVYELADQARSTVYVGSSDNLNQKLIEHMSSAADSCPEKQPYPFSVTKSKSEGGGVASGRENYCWSFKQIMEDCLNATPRYRIAKTARVVQGPASPQ